MKSSCDYCGEKVEVLRQLDVSDFKTHTNRMAYVCEVCWSEHNKCGYEKESLEPWQLQYLSYIMAESNEDLLDGLIYDSRDYHADSFTYEGEWKFHALEDELKKRLKDWLQAG